ncbi:MAG: hypothetical protein JWL58_1594 [Streptosporangiaceae bacterium]|nr:hypothetical protein [Streptosporangiaceae bacterium]
MPKYGYSSLPYRRKTSAPCSTFSQSTHSGSVLVCSNSATSSGEGSLTLSMPPWRAWPTSFLARALPRGEAKAAEM